MHTLSTIASFTLSLVVVHAVPLNIYNQCSDSIELYDNSATETIASGGSTTRTLTAGFNGMFRNGVGSQATLAEFSITGGYIWYDISIIPTGSTGPGNCGSLEVCKTITGGTGFNTAMQIAPLGCATVTCMADGCADAYQYPSDDGKTHSCSDTTTIDLIFCPGGYGASASTTPAPTTAAPTTTVPTPVPTLALKTPAPTPVPTPVPTQATTETPTQAPIAARTPEPTTATPQPTTVAPTSEPATEASKPLVTEIPQLVSTSSSFSSDGSFNSSNSSSLDSEDTSVLVTPEMKSTSAPATRCSSGAGNDRTVSTQSEYSGTSTGTYVVSIVGSLVVMAAVAAVVVARRKKQELEAMTPKESISSYMGALTPRGEINVMHA